MSWYSANKTPRSTPKSSTEGNLYANILRNEPELLKAQRQKEYDLSIPKKTASKLLQSVKEIDLSADRAAYTRAKRSGYTNQEAMDLVTKIRNSRDEKRAEDTRFRTIVARQISDHRDKERKESLAERMAS